MKQKTQVRVSNKPGPALENTGSDQIVITGLSDSCRAAFAYDARPGVL